MSVNFSIVGKFPASANEEPLKRSPQDPVKAFALPSPEPLTAAAQNETYFRFFFHSAAIAPYIVLIYVLRIFCVYSSISEELETELTLFHSLDPCSRWEHPDSRDGERWVELVLRVQLEALENGMSNAEIARKYWKVKIT